MYYLNGIMAGALSKSGKAGYVGAFPTSEVIRHINAFALGFKAANPKGTVSVRWINSWYDPGKAKEAAESLVAEGCDALAFTEDSPSVIEVAQNHTKAGKQIYAFSHYSPMEKYGPDSVVSGELVNWGPMYVQILSDIKAGKITDWSKYDLYWKAKEGAAFLGSSAENPVNPKFIPALKAVKIKTPDLGTMNAYDLSMKRYDQVKAETFEPYTGPIKDQSGKVRIAAGKKATVGELIAIDYFVDNVKGEIPKQ
jgi:basic membrane protein A and related proteins